MMNDMHNKWDDMIESKNELLKSLARGLSHHGDEDLSTILEKESDEVIKSSVEDLVPIPSESEDTSWSDSECDLPSYNHFSPINISKEKYVTFSNPLFDLNDDFTSSDDESLSDEDVPKHNVKIYLNPLFEFDDEYISSDVNPLFNEVLEDIKGEDSYLSKMDEPDLLVTPLSKLNEDECFDPGSDFVLEEIKACLTSDSIPSGIYDENFDPEGDIILLEKLLNGDPPSPLPLKELNFEELKVIKSDVSTDFEDDYYDSELSGEKSSDEEYERDCEIRIRKLKQDFNEWGSEVRKKEQDYNEERYSDARRRMLSIPFVDEDDYIPLGDIIARYSTSKSIIPDLPIEEPDNSLSMGDEHLDTTPSIENLVPIPSEFEGMSDDTCDVPNCDNNRINVESDLVESLINRDTSIVHSSKINPILEEFAGELAHIASIPPGIVEADFDPNDDTSSDDDDFEDIEYVKLRRRRNDDKKRKNFTLKIFFKSETFILQEKLINVHKRPIEPDQEGLISIDNSNNTLLELPEFESFHFYPPFPRPPPEPPDVEICLYFEPDVPVIDNFNELNVTKGKGE
ncbi:hypothetical protein Tco_0390383 [Tanacetum coccineum]